MSQFVSLLDMFVGHGEYILGDGQPLAGIEFLEEIYDRPEKILPHEIGCGRWSIKVQEFEEFDAASGSNNSTRGEIPRAWP
jgi:hypothetical protein